MTAKDNKLNDDEISDGDLKKMSPAERNAYFDTLPAVPNFARLLEYAAHVGTWGAARTAKAQAETQAEAQAKAQAETQQNKRVRMVAFRSSRTKRARQAAPTVTNETPAAPTG